MVRAGERRVAGLRQVASLKASLPDVAVAQRSKESIFGEVVQREEGSSLVAIFVLRALFAFRHFAEGHQGDKAEVLDERDFRIPCPPNATLWHFGGTLFWNFGGTWAEDLRRDIKFLLGKRGL